LKVDKLTIRNFRNIATLDVSIPGGGVVIIGANGEGKTNLLESIYYLVLFRSFRGATDRELVRFGEAGFFVAATAGSRVSAGYEISGGRKKVTIDGVPATRLSDAVGELIAIPFSPIDREIVSGSPSGRRRYLDVLLALSSKNYLRQLTSMRSALKQRNAALRRGEIATAKAFNGAFVTAAAQVGRQRVEWVETWASRYGAICRDLGEKSEPAIHYRSRGWEPALGEENLLSVMTAQLDRDARHGATTVGPHRDDLTLYLGDKLVRTYGSAGQQRTAAIGLRVLEGETVTKETGKVPVALYDDVFVELDEDRQERLLGLIRDSLPGQAIMTVPRESEIPRSLFDRPRWRMCGGVLAAA
jgi:DNA replication and repair protein RecF